MKTIKTLLVFVLIITACVGIQAQPIGKLSDQQVKDKIQKFSGMRTTGIVLTFIGAPALIAGIALYVDGLSSSTNSSGSATDIDGKVWAGIGLMVVGEVALGGGIVLWAIGANKTKKYTNEYNKRQQSLSLRTSKYGIGLAYRF
ncbi:MAG: hypothetical protein KKA81_10765 [Bacteroidetes bacterium]|nr:hypothetical protein [Bacteroidota bacterium]